MPSKVVLHHMYYSPPSRFAVITAKHIGLDVEVKDVDMFTGAHMTPEFKAINPTSTVPAMTDGDVAVFDSSAIAIYLVEKYAKEDSLYPKDVVARAKVNEKLFYVSSYMFPRVYQAFVPIYFGSETCIAESKMIEFMRGYQTIDDFLNGSEYLAGNTLTLADLSLWPLMESLAQVIPIEKEKFPNFDRWMNKMREHPCYEMNKKGADDHIEFFRKRLQENIDNAEN